MSLQEFSSELDPETGLRLLVRAVALAAALAGVIVILDLPFSRGLRAALLVAWVAHVSTDLVRLVRSQRGCLGIRVAAGGNVQIVTPDGCCIAATLRPGCVVTRRFAWLCFDAENGRRYRELVRAKSPQNHDWRRFQVIWRHLGAEP